MNREDIVVVGIDVGAKKKGFHAVSLLNGVFEIKSSDDPAAIVAWCRKQTAKVVAVDAPCNWGQSGRSRATERDLRIGDKKIHCFATPTRAIAFANQKGFYDWVFNGEKLYRELKKYFPLFDRDERRSPICFETFPQAIVCAFAGRKVPAQPKVSRRRSTLRVQGYDDSALPNIDFIDAALCALAAQAFLDGRICKFGNKEEGFIVIPVPTPVSQPTTEN